AAEAADRLLAVNFQQRYRPEVRAAHEIIRSGKLGELQYANMVVVWPRTRRYFANAGWRGTWKGEGGGVLLNQAPHNLDLLCHLMGMPTSLVAWTRTRVHAIETEDTVQAMFEWDNGAVGSLHVSTAESGQPERLEILGTAGRLEVGRGHIVLQEFDQDVRTFFVETDAIYSGPPSHDVAVTLPESNGDHVDIYADLQRAITTGTPLMADGRDARMSLELANAMILSSYQQGAVSLPLDRAAYGTLLAQLQEA
ncbi:MAG: Gfo/Idh/MocA family oxidoreductase, partial [Caldilineaceae bacterium]|nr:Gfo/Idh/MocA family oxidoreductase [Caldilineaceae bacterium]